MKAILKMKKYNEKRLQHIVSKSKPVGIGGRLQGQPCRSGLIALDLAIVSTPFAGCG